LKTGEKLYAIYWTLLQRYGDRHWWPAETPFEMMVGAILTQNVSWANSAIAISNLKDADLLAPHGIRNAPTEKIAPLIKPARFMNLKTKRLKGFVEWYESEFDADIGRMYRIEMWNLRERLLEVDGIGEETADCIILYACNLPIFVIDAYTRRIFGRLGFLHGDPSYGELQLFFMHNLPQDTGLFKDYHAQLVHLAKDICRKKPLCGRCPLKQAGKDFRCFFACSNP
jgi:endonuclease-3 related protein